MKNILIIAGIIAYNSSVFAMTAHPQNGTAMLEAAKKYEGAVVSCDLSSDDPC